MKDMLLIIALTLGVTASAQEKIKEACAAADAESCVELGAQYQLGKDVNQSYEKANIYYGKACDLNHSTGCINLGDLYYLGQGVEQNNSKSKLYYDKACKLNNQNGCNYFKSLVDEEEDLRQKKDELEQLKQEQKELIEEAEVLDNI